jgi:paraquat-inducible protein B
MDPYTPEGVSQRDINSEEELEDAQTRKDKRFADLEGKLVEERREESSKEKRAEMQEEDLIEQLQLIRGRYHVEFGNPWRCRTRRQGQTYHSSLACEDRNIWP